MAVFFKLYQEKRKNLNTTGKWYARAITLGESNLKTISERIQRNCSLKESDVNAVLIELVEVMNEELQAGRAVVLNGFGRFKMGLSSRPADSAKEWDITKHLAGVHVNFQPEAHRDNHTGKYLRTFVTGVKLKEAPKTSIADDGADE